MEHTHTNETKIMSVDITDRLKHVEKNCGDEYLAELAYRSAKEITMLREENERLREQLKFWIVDVGGHESVEAAYDITSQDATRAST